MDRTCFQINNVTNETINALTGDVPRINRSDVVRAAVLAFKRTPKRERVKMLTDEFNVTEKERLRKVEERKKKRLKGA